MNDRQEPTLETERLALRPPRPEDVPALFAFMGDPQVMRHTRPQASLADLTQYLAVQEAQRHRVGCAPWVLTEKAGARRLVGFGGLYEDPFDPGWGVEVGYFLHPDVWGRGYPTHLNFGFRAASVSSSRRSGAR